MQPYIIKKRGDESPPPEKKHKFKDLKENTINSLFDVEYFLNNFSSYYKYVKLFKLLK